MCGTDVLVKVSEVCGTVCSRFGTFGPHVALGHCWCRSDGVLPLARNSHVTPLARHATRTSRNSYVTPLVCHATRMSRHSHVTQLARHVTRTSRNSHVTPLARHSYVTQLARRSPLARRSSLHVTRTADSTPKWCGRSLRLTKRGRALPSLVEIPGLRTLGYFCSSS